MELIITLEGIGYTSGAGIARGGLSVITRFSHQYTSLLDKMSQFPCFFHVVDGLMLLLHTSDLDFAFSVSVFAGELL
jgi:hypothetical protein